MCSLRLENEFVNAGKGKIFGRLKVFLTGENATSSYKEVARELDMTEGAVKVTVHRMRRRVKSEFIKIRAFCRWLHEKGCLADNPCIHLSSIKVFDDVQPDHLTESEIGLLFRLVEQGTPYARVRDKLMFALMIYAGLRRIECVRIKWSDVDLEGRLLVVRNGKGGRHRLVPINDKLHSVLVNATRYGDHVLSSVNGRPVQRNTLTKVAERYLDKLNHHYQGRKRLSLHSLRSTFATRLCEKGASTRIVQGLLGHSDPRLTLRYAAMTDTYPAPLGVESTNRTIR